MSQAEGQHGARRLVLVRHAKTEQGSPDHERRLLDRGRRDATAAGAWLVAEVGPPDLVHVSTSTRTRQTWEVMASRTELSRAPVWPDRRIYQGHPADLLAVLTETPAQAATVVLVGHSPGVPALVGHLADHERSDPAALARLQESYPTMACAVLEPTTPWAALAEGGALLRRIQVPRG